MKKTKLVIKKATITTKLTDKAVLPSQQIEALVTSNTSPQKLAAPLFTKATPSNALNLKTPTSFYDLKRINSVTGKNKAESATLCYRKGLYFASQKNSTAALDAFNQAWMLGMNPLIAATDLHIFEQLYTSLMSLIMGLHAQGCAELIEFQQLILQTKNLNKVLLHVKKLASFQSHNLKDISPSFLLTSDSFFSKSEPEQQIINVSGFGNNCGLYALALGIKKILSANATDITTLSDVKKMIVEMDEVALTSHTSFTEKYGIALRRQLFLSLIKNIEFKKGRRENFLAYVVTQLAGNEEIPDDMLAFELSNQDFLSLLKFQWSSLSLALSNILVLASQLENACNAIIIATDILETVQKKTLDYFSHDNFTDESIKNFIEILWNTDLIAASTIFRKVIQLRKIFDAINFAKILDHRNGLDQINALFKVNLLNFIDAQVVDYLFSIAANTTIYESELINFSLLADYALTGEIRLNEYELKKTICRYVVEQTMLCEYETLYSNYCIYILKNPVMLTADELGCLADHLGVKLVIQFPGGKSYQSNQQADLLEIILCNISEDHWQVVMPACLAPPNLNIPIQVVAQASDNAKYDGLDEVTTDAETTDSELSESENYSAQFSR